MIESDLLQLQSIPNKLPCGHRGFLTVESDEIRTNPTAVIATEVRITPNAVEVVIPGRLARNKRTTLSLCAGALQFEMVADNYNLHRCGGEWRLTCELAPSLPIEVVRYLSGSKSGVVNLEHLLDEPVDVEAFYHDRGGKHPIAIHDSPDREMYLISHAPVEPRRSMRLSVKYSRNAVFVGLPQWQVSANGQSLVGWSFLLEDDRHRFRGLCRNAPRTAIAITVAKS